MNQYSKLTVAVVVVLRAVLSPGSCGGSENAAAQILDACRQHLNQVTAIAYESTLDATIFPAPGDNNDPNTECLRQTFSYSRGKYRSSLANCDSEGPPVLEFAYNGEIYQELNRRRSALNVTRARSRNPYMVMDVITTMHLFAFPPDANELSIEALQTDAVWMRLLSKARFVGHREVMNRPCDVVSFAFAAPAQSPNQQVEHEVAFAQDLQWFPIRIESSVDGVPASVWTATDFTPVPAGKTQVCIMPLRLEGSGFTASGVQSQLTVLTVDRATVKVNVAIPEDGFTLSAADVNEYHDNDLNL